MHSCTQEFSLISVDVDSLNFVNILQKNISWYVLRAIAQHVIWNLIVVQMLMAIYKLLNLI